MKNLPETLLLLLAIAIAVYATYIQLFYHENYQTFAWDLGIFLQSLETFVFHQKLFYNTVELPYNPSGSYFGIHFSPILFLIAIPYAIYPQPLTLFLVKNLLICLTSLVIYKIGREQGLSELNSTLIATTYLFFLPMYGPLTTDFHPYSLFPLLISLTHLYVLRKNHRATLITTILGLSTNEVAALLYTFYGLCLLIKGSREIAKKIILLSSMWFASAVAIITLLNPTQLQYYAAYHMIRQLCNKVPKSFNFNISTIINHDKAAYLMIVYGLLLLLPLLYPIEGILTILPWLLLILLSEHPQYYSPYYQYSAFISAQLFFATINSLRRLWKIRSRQIIAVILISLNISSAIIFGPIGFGFLDYATNFPRPAHFHTIYRFNLTGISAHNHEALKKALKLIPENASLLVQTHLFPHVYRRANSYVSLVPGVTGWPVIYESLNLRKIKWISQFSALDHERRFLGESKSALMILNDRKILFQGSNTTFRFEKAVNVKKLYFECQLKPENLSISQVILSSNAFELGLGSNGYLVLLIYSEGRESITKFSDVPLELGKWYKVGLNITSNEAVVTVNGQTTIKLRIKNRVVAWIVDGVDYVILDSTASTWGFRAGLITVILNSKYKLIAAGDGVMVFSANRVSKGIQNLTPGKHLMVVYPRDEPLGEPAITMPLSKLLWKPIAPPLAPQCLMVELEGESHNVTISGVEEYAFTRPSMKAYIAKRIGINCSAIIHGEIEVDEEGYYAVEIKKSIPSILEVRIDGVKIVKRKPIYLSSGSHSIEVIWKRIRYPLLELKLIKSRKHG